MRLDLDGGGLRSKHGGISQHAIRRARRVAATKRWKDAHPGYEKDWLSNHPGYRKAWRQKQRVKPQFVARELISNARRRAHQGGLDCTITIADLLPLPAMCPVLGIVLNYGGLRSCGGMQQEDAPSLDRIDNAKGYVPGNVAVISWRANRLKSDASILELRRILAYIEHHRFT